MHKNDNSLSKSKSLLFKLRLLKLEIETLKSKVISDEKEDALDKFLRLNAQHLILKNP